MTTDDDAIPANLAEIRRRITLAAQAAGRDPAGVTLVAVTKTHPAAAVRAALAAGQAVFGENRVQEAAAKYPELQAAHPALRLHLIGPLQTNKAKAATALFDVIESLDRPALAEELAVQFTRQGRRPNCFIQVNTGLEPQKAGIAPADLPEFLAGCRGRWGLPVTGLMAIPPAGEEPAPHFALLAKLARRHGLPDLSMGMSGDFETAVQLGATHVRVGTAIFGTRPPTPEHTPDRAP